MTSSEEDAVNAAVTSNSDQLVEPLESWARKTAIAMGMVASGSGGFAVFVSDNQAGTAFLLLVGVTLLLLGLQGTPLRRFGSGNSVLELALIRRRALDVVTTVEQNEVPEVAAAVVDAVAQIDPQVGRARVRDRSYSDDARHYEAAVIRAIERLGLTVTAAPKSGGGDLGVDAQVETQQGRVNVEVKYLTRGSLLTRQVFEAVGRSRLSGFEGGLVVVTNAPLSGLAEFTFNTKGADTVEVVTWNGGSDDHVLERVLIRNAR